MKKVLFATCFLSMSAVAVSAYEQSDTLLLLGLPVVELTTADSSDITSKTEWQRGARIRITLPDGKTDLDTTMSIRGRGNSTWRFPKKPYYIKLDNKAAVLDMPADRRWVLLAEWMDRTLMRNGVALEIGRRTCSRWVPRGRHVNLVVNGRHKGVYFLCEKIRISRNRLDIGRLEAGDKNLSGGYILELDTYFDELHKFRSSVLNMPYMVKEPDDDELTDDELNYIAEYVNDMEEALSSGSSCEEWLDATSFAEWWIVHEMTGNREPMHPKSTYMYKVRDGRLCAGPVWDFDSGTFMPVYAHKSYAQRFIYFPWLFQQYEFLRLLCGKWAEVRSRMLDIHGYIDSVAAVLRPSEAVNAKMWPITTHVNGDESDTFDDAVARMHSFIDIKIPAIDQFLSQQVEGIEDHKIVNCKSVNCKLYDLTGRRLAAPPARGVYIEERKIRLKH